MAKIHFIGIGGVGMSALAEISLEQGKTVTGSDLRLSNLTDKLVEKGVKVFSGHDASHISSDTDIVVRSACIRDSNPEVERAKALNIPVISRSEMLKSVLESADTSVVVTGTHGKTTSSALISYITEKCGKDPTVLVGGVIEHFGGNAKCGRLDFVVAELDESDGFFRNVAVKYAVITNVEREHIENYGSMENLISAYGEFINRIDPHGIFVFNGEDPVLRDISFQSRAKKIDFGIDGDFKYAARDVSFDRSISFGLVKDGKAVGNISSRLLGRHNVMNILGVTALCMEMGMGFSEVAEAVSGFKTVKRRFDLVGNVGTIEVFEDYGHHPTEIRSVITAARNYTRGRVIAVFQPHRYTRTMDMADDFAKCFYGADVLILTDIYSADEDPIPGVGTADIIKKMDTKRFELVKLMDKDGIADFLSAKVRDNDVVMVLGAGNIREIAGPLVEKIKKVRGKKA